MTDWNWFFASIAQAVGALIGVLIAFLVATITTAKTRFGQNVATTRSLIAEAKRLEEALGVRRFERFNRVSLERLAEAVRSRFTDEYGGTAPLRNPEAYLAEISTRAFVPYAEIVAVVRQTIDEERENREEAKRAAARKQAEEEQRKRHPLLGSSLYQGGTFSPSIEQQRFWDKERRDRVAQERRDADAEFDSIQLMRVEVSTHVRRIQEHLREIESNSERSALVSRVIVGAGVFFLLGVEWPLAMTPLPQTVVRVVSPVTWWGAADSMDAIKALILAIAGVLFVGMLVILWRENDGLEYRPEDADELRYWLELSNYSKYLVARVETAAQSPLNSG